MSEAASAGSRPGDDASQKRALFYVFDGGTGIGHLRRLACIARQLQGRFACLIVTGHREAAHWFVPQACEYVHLPSWDSLIAEKARYWGREPFADLDRRGAIVSRTRCRKYLVTRGVMNETEDLRRLILGGRAHQSLATHYDRIFAAADPKVFDFARQYNIAPALAEKTRHVGYVTQQIRRDLIARSRAERGLSEGEIWVVASAGGGQLGEGLIQAALDLPGIYPDIAFDIVMGPRSNLAWPDRLQKVIDRGRLRLHKDNADMPLLNAGADLVLTSGGYNTLLEALQGQADLLCFPLRKDKRDEQYQHAVRLRKFVNIEVSTDLADLSVLFEQAIGRLRRGRSRDRRAEIDLGGAANIERIVSNDLGRGA